MATPPSPIICVHLDLKGVAFKAGYVPQLMRDLAAQGVNAVLVEYEDVFPFKNMEIAYDAKSRWSPARLRAFRREATANGIDIIPLQQCLGHLEYLFRWKAYAGFAEDRRYPSTLCLSNERGKALIKGMLRQVMQAHPESRFVHLGMDEAVSLHKAAERDGRPVLEVFIEYLEELIDVAEQCGKTPIIWSDMLEDHFQPGIFDSIKHRVILSPWDYNSRGSYGPLGRIDGGFRMSKEWLDEPDNPDAPPIHPGSRFFEDLPEQTKALIEEYRRGREIVSFFPVDLWTKLGFRVIGATAIRVSSQGCVLPNYQHLYGNITGWAEAITRSKQMGLIGTSWARGTTFCPPNFNMDLTWPCISKLAESLGARPEPFFPGIPRATVDALLAKLSRCRKDWSIEESLGAEMAALEPQLTAHQFEWKTLQLMIRVLALHRRVDYAISEVDFFRSTGRPVTPEWQRRLDDQRQIIADLKRLRAEVKTHFGQRHEGAHFDEWLGHLFDVPVQKLRAIERESRAFQRAARARYGW